MRPSVEAPGPVAVFNGGVKRGPKKRPDQLLSEGGAWIEALNVPAALFGAAASLRGALYDRGLLPVARVAAPVVCSGNLSAGGTGKTPLTLFLARWFVQRGWRPGVLSRGHGRERLQRAEGQRGQPQASSDEGRLYDLLLPGIRRVEDRDRVRGALALLDAGADVILLDDGFQHRRLHRDLDLVLVDCLRPWGLPWDPERGPARAAFLPRGLLREPKRALARASALVLSRADQIPSEALAGLQAELLRLAPAAAQVLTRHRPRCLRDGGGGEHGLNHLADREVDLLSGIGNPEAFERTVTGLGARVHSHRRFGDHHAYRAEDLHGLGAGGRPVITTEKDLVKLSDLLPGALALSIELEVLAGQPILEALLEALPRSERAFLRQNLHEGLHG